MMSKYDTETSKDFKTETVSFTQLSYCYTLVEDDISLHW